MYYSYSPKPQPVRKKLLNTRVMTVMLVFSGLILIFLLNITNTSPSPTGQENQTNKTKSTQQPTSVVGKYLFSGTVVIARAVENEARKAGGSIYDQPFSKLSTLNPEQYDAWEADIECPVTLEQISYQVQVANTVFNCRPEFLPAMRKYISIANVANNHTEDMGADGYKETVKHLEDAGYQTIGNANPHKKDDICEVIALPVRLQKPDKSEVDGTLPIAFCAWHYFSYKPEAGEIETMDRYAKIMPVFAFMQVGVEYRATADTDQISIGHKIIDRGPEFLIGNSPHWVQNTEAYKGKLIVYSTGNFIFDQLDTETNRGVSIDVDMNIPYDDNVAKWLALGDQCKTRSDDCLQKAEQQGLNKIKPTLTYKPVVTVTGYRKITAKADPATEEAVLERMNWTKTLQGLR